MPRVCEGLMDRDYASYDDVPYHSRWRHFEAGGLDRTARLKTAWDGSKSCDDLGRRFMAFLCFIFSDESCVGGKDRRNGKALVRCLLRQEKRESVYCTHPAKA